MDAVWPYLAAILPTILVAILFYFLIKSMLEGDRRERIAQRRFEAEQDRERDRAAGTPRIPKAATARRTSPPRRPANARAISRATHSRPLTCALPFGESAANVLSGIADAAPDSGSENPEGKTMAKKVQVLLVDDIDKSSPADETVSFSLDGVSYEIDLTSDNAAKLRDDLAVWIGHAERTGGRRSTGRTASKGSGRKADLGAVRAWARDNGHQVSDRGRISAEVQAAYDKAHG